MVINKVNQRTAKHYAIDFVSYLRNELRVPIHEAYLFGSYAKGKQRDWSDVDVAVISKKFKGRIDPLVFLSLQKRRIDDLRRIEAVGFHPDDFVPEDPLVYEIMMSGIKLKV